jgi:hypothetical protein
MWIVPRLSREAVKSLSMYECPRCHSACISSLDKLLLGPAKSMQCPRCGGKVGVAFGPAIIAVLPAIFSVCVILVLLPSFLPLPDLHRDVATSADVARAVNAVIVFIFAAVLASLTPVLYLRWVPLIPR